MDFVDEFLQLIEALNGSIWVKVFVGALVLVFSFLSLLFSIKKNKVLSNTDISKQVAYVSKAMSILVPAVNILLDQKKGLNKNENESIEKGCETPENQKL